MWIVFFCGFMLGVSLWFRIQAIYQYSHKIIKVLLAGISGISLIFATLTDTHEM